VAMVSMLIQKLLIKRVFLEIMLYVKANIFEEIIKEMSHNKG